jgi:hypothetical protein
MDYKMIFRAVFRTLCVESIHPNLRNVSGGDPAPAIRDYLRSHEPCTPLQFHLIGCPCYNCAVLITTII